MPAVDPFLFHHLVESLHVNIGGRLGPLSIRDQITRGRLAVERALDAKLIGGARKLLVLGAGMGGVTAAMSAASAGIDVTLMDQSRDPFSRHASCRRWVDPTQYDWPVGHWSESKIPWPAMPSLPVPPIVWSKADRANLLVGDWTVLYKNFRTTPQGRSLKEQFLTRCTAVTHVKGSSVVRVDWEKVDRRGNATGHAGHDDYGLVISAKGFGDERCFLEYADTHPSGWRGHPYRSFEFWANDPFETPRLGVAPRPGPEPRPRVLISGAGDGALQDFLRIMTRCKSAKEIWGQLGLASEIVAKVAAIVRDAEDQATRALVWGAGAVHDHDILSRLEAAHREAVDLVARVPGIEKALESLIRHDVAEIRLVHSCDHLGAGYALNKFLALLILGHLQAATEYGQAGPIRWPGRRVVEVDCLGHPGVGSFDARACHRHAHEVTTRDEADCRMVRMSPDPPPPPLIGPVPGDQATGEFDVIVLRHGIIAPDLRAKMEGTEDEKKTEAAIAVKMGRQVLPYHHPA